MPLASWQCICGSNLQQVLSGLLCFNLVYSSELRREMFVVFGAQVAAVDEAEESDEEEELSAAASEAQK